jgi:multidrug resistance efflux pump
MALSINDIATQLAADLSLQEARIREAGVQLARIEADITAAQDEATRVQAVCKAAIQNALREQSEYEQAAAKAKSELAMVLASLNVQRATLAQDVQDHQTKVNEARAQARAAERDERDNIARLVVQREDVRSEIRALVNKLKELA